MTKEVFSWAIRLALGALCVAAAFDLPSWEPTPANVDLEYHPMSRR